MSPYKEVVMRLINGDREVLSSFFISSTLLVNIQLIITKIISRITKAMVTCGAMIIKDIITASNSTIPSKVISTERGNRLSTGKEK